MASSAQLSERASPASPPRLSRPESLRSRIVGAWELVSWKAINVEDPEDVIYPMGKDCKGSIIYSPDGYVSVILQQEDVAPFAAGWRQGTANELATAAQKTVAYSGPYYINRPPGKEEERIIHHVTLGLPSNLSDTLQFRSTEIGEESGAVSLVLGPEEPGNVAGVQRWVRLRWRRAQKNLATEPPVGLKELKL